MKGTKKNTFFLGVCASIVYMYTMYCTQCIAHNVLHTMYCIRIYNILCTCIAHDAASRTHDAVYTICNITSSIFHMPGCSTICNITSSIFHMPGCCSAI